MDWFKFLFLTPWSFWIISFAVSLYYGYRGYRFCTYYKKEEMEKLQMEKWDKRIIWYIQDSIFNFVCGMAGFLSLRLMIQIWTKFKGEYLNIQPGLAILFGVFSFIAILGVSGSLPRILSRFGFPKG